MVGKQRYIPSFACTGSTLVTIDQQSECMSWGFSRFNHLSSVLVGTATALVFVLSQGLAGVAKTSQEVGQIAVSTTVQINDNGGGSGGSGVIVARQGNTYTVFTASHVVCERYMKSPCRTDLTYTIRTHQGKDYPVTHVQILQNSENDPDLAVVTFETIDEYPIANLGDSDQAVIGADIYVGGFPSVKERSGAQRNLEFTQGIVSSRLQSGSQGYTLRYNCVTWPGMSGGPVFDANGRVVGIHGQGEDGSTNQQESGEEGAIIKTGFNAAIPINTLLALRSQIGPIAASLTVDKTNLNDSSSNLDNPTAAKDYNSRGLSRADQGNQAGAIADYSQAVKLDPDKSEAYFNRGNILQQQGNYQGAIADYTEVIQKKSDFSPAYANRGIARVKVGDYQGAIADWTEALKLGPSDAKTHFNRGLAYSRMGKQQEAIADYTQALQIQPDYAAAYNNRGTIREDLGDSKGAMEDYTQAIQKNSGYANAYNNRAVLRAAQGDRQGAIQDLQSAAQLLLNQGKTVNYQQVMENLRRLQR